MTIKGIKSIARAHVSTAAPSPAIGTGQAANNGMQNGVGAFILQCKKMDFHYCDWAGSSKGMKYVAHSASEKPVKRKNIS